MAEKSLLDGFYEMKHEVSAKNAEKLSQKKCKERMMEKNAAFQRRNRISV